MASNGVPRQRRKSGISFSTANIGTSSSQSLEEVPLLSPSQLVLGYSSGKLLRTPSVNSSPNVKTGESPKSPTPRSYLPSHTQPRVKVNHPRCRFGDKTASSPFVKSRPAFATSKTQPRDLSSTARMEASKIPAQVPSLPSDDWNAFGENLQREVSNLQPTKQTSVDATQSTSTSTPNPNSFPISDFLNFSDDMNKKEKEQAPSAQGPVTPSPEQILTANCEFPVNTDADKQQWKAAIKTNTLTPNPFNLSMPSRSHHRSESQGSQKILSNNSNIGNTTSSKAANDYIQMIESVEKANMAKGQEIAKSPSASTQVATTNTGNEPFSGPSVAIDMGPDFEANLAEMMETLKNSKPGDPAYLAITGGHQSTQNSSMGMGMGQGLGDMSHNGFQMHSDSRTSVRPMNHATAQETMTNSGNSGVPTPPAMQISTPYFSSMLQPQFEFPYSMTSINNSTPGQNFMNSGSQAGGSSSIGQGNVTGSFLRSGSPSYTQIPQFSVQGNSSNNGEYGGGYDRDAQGGNLSHLDPSGMSSWKSNFTSNTFSMADMGESSTQGAPVASMVGSSPSTQTNAGTNMVGSSTQASSSNAGGYPSTGPSFTSSNQGNLLSVPGGYNMSFVPSIPSQMAGGALASTIKSNAQTLQMSPPRSAAAQNSATPAHGHTRSNSMGSEHNRMGPQGLSLSSLPVRSPTPNQSAINLARTASPALSNTAVRPTRSDSAGLTVPNTPNISLEEVSPNPLHPASFHRDTPRTGPDPPLMISPNPLHPPSFHSPTPRAKWPTSHVPIPPNTAVCGNSTGYFQPSQYSNPLGTMSNNMLQNPASLQAMAQQEMQLNRDIGRQLNAQVAQELHRQTQQNVREFIAAQSAIDREYQQNLLCAPTPPGSSQPDAPNAPDALGAWGFRPNNPFQHNINQIEWNQPMTFQSTEDIRPFKVADKISSSLRGYSLNNSMPSDGKSDDPLPQYMIMSPRIQRRILEGREEPENPLALDLLAVVENFACDFCSGQPNLYGIGPYSHDFVEIWGPAGHDWCSECQKSGKHLVPDVSEKKDQKGKGRKKRPANESADPEPSSKKPSRPLSRTSSTRASTPSSSTTPTSYDRYAPLSIESNVFGDPQEVFSSIDNIMINPFMHNLMCRGSDHRQIDIAKTKICEPCKTKKQQIITHGCHNEFTHIVALNADGQWQFGYNRGAPGLGQVDGPDDLDTNSVNNDDFKFNVDADLNDGMMTLADIHTLVSECINPGINSGMTTGMNPSMSDNLNSDITDTELDDMFDFDFEPPSIPSTPVDRASLPANSAAAHNHLIHMNGKPHGPISKFCMICPSPSVFLCDGCPLTLCERCRYALMECEGWFNNLIYRNGVGHGRNDAFLLRSDNGGYHEWGVYWPIPPHVGLRGD